MHTVIVVGGGAAGLFAAYSASLNNNRVILLEKNEKLGKKLYITGKGRCNLTNNVSVPEFLNNVVSNSKFLYSALNSFSPLDVMNFFEAHGCKLKIERGNRVFPISDKSSDVIKTLQNALISNGVEIKLNSKVIAIIVKDKTVVGVSTENETIACDSVIVCTGGVTYPLTGSTGDGYKFANKTGHAIVEPKPSLVGLELKDEDFLPLQGLSVQNVAILFNADGREVYRDFGEMLFTHFGVSGPIILSASCLLNRLKAQKIILKIDLKPALDEKTLNERLLREFDAAKHKSLYNVMHSLLPQTLIETILKTANVSGEKRCCDVTKLERNSIVFALKNLQFEMKGFRPIDEAIVTSGGVSVKEINPKTMESKFIKGLFFAGEVMDVDAFTGGFNIQIAFSTGFVAGNNA